MNARADAAARPRPEYRLILCIAQGSQADAGPVRDLLQQGLDWPLLLRTAGAHGVAPLLEWQLSRLAPEAVPAPAREELRRRFRDNALHSLVLGGELVRLARLFSAHAVSVLPFKGPTLAARAYSNLALREFVDLDLLLAPVDVPRARRLLEGAGYRSALPLAPAQADQYLASIGQMPFRRDEPQVLVELHARLMPRDFHFPLGLDRLWPRRRPVVVAGQEIFTLADEDLLLLLCAHGAKHGWSRLGWVADVAALVRACPNLAWADLTARARSLRSGRILALGLLLAHDLLQAPVPKGVVSRARSSPAVRRLAALVAREMFREADGRPRGLDEALFQLRLRERPWDGLRYALTLALAPTVADWTSVRLPAALSFLYQVLRPIRLAAKYGRHALVRGRSGRPDG